jgi:glutaredoxin 3
MSETRPAVVVYSSPFCGYCAAAKRLLRARGVEFTELDVLAEPDLRSEMVARSGGRRTVPQIFIGDIHVGGYDDLRTLEDEGKLDALLGDAPAG